VSEFLVIRLAEEPAQASWLVLNEQGHRLSRTMSGPLAAAVPESRNREVILLAPGIDAVARRVTLPVKRQARIEQMLPYTLEEAVAEDVDTLLFAAGPRRDDGTIPVAIVARELVAGWLKECADAGLKVDALFVDIQGVPETPGNLTLLLDHNKVYGRLPDREPFVFEDLSLDELIEVLESETDPSAYLKNLVVYADDDAYRKRATELERIRERAASLDLTTLPDGVLPRLAATFVTESGSNLLQGPFRVRSDWNAILRPWRFPALLIVALVAAATLTEAGRYLVLSREDQALTNLVQSSCQAGFGAATLAACDSELQSRLAASGAEAGRNTANGFLETLASVADARDQRMQIQALSFRDGVTNLRVRAPDVQSLDTLVQALGKDGRFQANIQSTAPGDDGVEGRLQIAGLQR